MQHLKDIRMEYRFLRTVKEDIEYKLMMQPSLAAGRLLNYYKQVCRDMETLRKNYERNGGYVGDLLWSSLT